MESVKDARVCDRIEAITGREIVVGDVKRLADSWHMTMEDVYVVLDANMGSLDAVLLPELCDEFNVNWQDLLGL